MSNEEINEIIALSGIKRYEIANMVGCTEYYFCRLFRQPLNDKWKKKILSVIKETLIKKRNEINEILEKMEETNNESI